MDLHTTKKNCALKIRSTISENKGKNINYWVMLDKIQTDYGLNKKFLDDQLNILKEMGVIEIVSKTDEKLTTKAIVIKCL